MEIIRSATFEGMADTQGFPTGKYLDLYETLAKNKVKNMITGFMFVSDEGRAMQIGQAGMDSEDKVAAFREVTDAVHKYGSRIVAQIAHAGRQTTKTGYRIVGVSDKKSIYFGETPHVLTSAEIHRAVDDFVQSALYAKKAGFDGVQLHAAHGYLIHQFLLCSLNNRTDEFGDGALFLRKIIVKIREKCGGFPIWVKLSGGVDVEKRHRGQFVKTIGLLDALKVDLIEISYGTMDYALNIFRGGLPFKTIFKHNPIYKNKGLAWKAFVMPRILAKRKPFTPQYNIEYAKSARRYTDIPISVVGGFRTLREAEESGFPYISLCRPLICEPDFLLKSERDAGYKSKCVNCNICAVMTDTKQSLRCYGGRKIE
jgi:2,4-dienoyl-CoA reductase-like NADH-dependent reductase (Old Yellow Enzyme family)